MQVNKFATYGKVQQKGQTQTLRKSQKYVQYVEDLQVQDPPIFS